MDAVPAEKPRTEPRTIGRAYEEKFNDPIAGFTKPDPVVSG